MFRNYFKIAWRNLIANKGFSAINIGGLSVGIAVAILIGLWIYSELSFNKNFENYDRIAQVWQHQEYNGIVGSQVANPAAMGPAIEDEFGGDFKYVIQSSWTNAHALTFGDKVFFKTGNYFEPEITEMLSLKMIYGNRDGLKEMHAVLLSKSTAEVFFDDEDPVGKILKLNNQVDVKVTGVYEDLPENSSFNSLEIILP
ncbi:Acidobacterial duplicated orphan permease (function unknown), partial [hydrothermal vent metagenome]